MFGLLVSLLCINNILPPINKIYITNINIPLIGKQNILYERTEKYKSKLILNGIVNSEGNIYYDKKNVYNYELNNNLINILKKYKCSFSDANYDVNNDIISLKLKIKIIGYTTKLILQNIGFSSPYYFE